MTDLSKKTKKEFADRLKAERKRLKKSVVQLCDEIEISRASQRLYEKGERLPDLDYIYSLKNLGFNLSFLIMGNEPLTTPLLSKAFELTDELTELSFNETGKILSKEHQKKMFLKIISELEEKESH